MPKVYVVNNNGNDFSAAKKYGELVYLSMGVLNLKEFEEIYKKFYNMLQDFDVKQDYLLLTGNNLFCAVAASILTTSKECVNLAVEQRDVKVLFWSRGEYNIYEL